MPDEARPDAAGSVEPPGDEDDSVVVPIGGRSAGQRGRPPVGAVDQ
ncbi:MAG: hypothetical protein ACR2KK_09300 [Acidimicrobiales bacterium]